MSPLACSLLALAALLATVDAQYHCITKKIGRTRSSEVDDQIDLVPVDVPYKRSNYLVNDYCEKPRHAIGEKVTVCNQSPGPWGKPYVSAPPCPKLSPVKIYCHDPAGCRVFTTEFCDDY